MIGLRLSFIVGVISSPPGSHKVGRIANRLICSTRESLALPAATPAAISRDHLRVGGQGGGRASASPCCGRVRADRVGVEDHQRGVVRPAVADRRSSTPTIGQRGQDRVLDVGRRHVLSGRVDDQFLLAVDDPEVAVGVDSSDVAGVQPAVGVDRLGGLRRLACGSPSSPAGRGPDLAVLGDLALQPGQQLADGAEPRVVRW